MKIGKQNLESYMTMKFDFPGVRVIGNMLCPVNWKMEIELVALDTSATGVTEDDLQMNGSIAYQKVFFWLETCLHMCVFVDTINDNGMAIATASGNVIMHCPDEPSDDMLIKLIHAKLSAIAAGHLYIGKIRLESSDTSAMYTYSMPESGYGLPCKVKDYIDLASFYRKPWWERDDGWCFELLRPKGCKETLQELYGEVRDPLEEFNDSVSFTLEEIHAPKEPAEIIQVEKWQPRTV